MKNPLTLPFLLKWFRALQKPLFLPSQVYLLPTGFFVYLRSPKSYPPFFQVSIPNPGKGLAPLPHAALKKPGEEAST